MNQPRLWIEANKCHYRVRNVFWQMGKIAYVFYESTPDDLRATVSNLSDGDVLELSTGETDRNRKEIFAGDRVQFVSEDARDDGEIYDVKFKNGLFTIFTC